MFAMGPRYSELEARAAIAASRSFAEALRHLGMCASGGNGRTLRRYAVEIWAIPTDHFDPHAASREALRRNQRTARPLSEVLVEGSSFSRVQLKKRLYAEGVKRPVCEMCGQGEMWRGRRLSLILDHVNGVSDDNRLANLRIVCPNCAATLDTHCGRNVDHRRLCATCGAPFRPAVSKQRHCSHRCGARSPESRAAHDARRRVQRPPYEQLTAEIAATNWSAVGRKYGVSDNAIRKWVRAYEAERASAEQDGAAGGGVPAPVRVTGAEMDASQPAVDRRAGGGAGEDGLAGGRELVATIVDREQRVEVGSEREHRGVADPGWVLGGDGGGEELARPERGRRAPRGSGARAV